MSEQIFAILKRKLDDLATYGNLDAETRLNTLKEELQFYVLNFIYHHQEYSKWIMYGGSALRIIHGLDRMSVDLDFEMSHKITNQFLEKLKNEIKKYFKNTYGADDDFLIIKITTGRGLLLKFYVGERLSFGYPSNQVYIKIDLNYFIAPQTVTERRPVNQNQFSFVIITYNMSALMASKIAAIFLRGSRGIGKAIYEEKGRDIYDLLWYMNKKITPDFDYLIAKNIDIKNIKALFDKLTLQMNKVSDKNLKQDLTPLFVDKAYISNWLKNWRENYLYLLDEYRINTITKLESIEVHQNFNPTNFSFVYWHKTEEGRVAQITYNISEYWIKFREGDISTAIDNKVSDLVQFSSNSGNTMSAPLQKKLKQYATIFYKKTEKYLEKINKIILGDSITTKIIRMSADNLNQKEEILLNKSALLSCETDDLLK